MKQCVYRETLDLAWSKEKFCIKGRNGTRIYKEVRKNHIPGMVRLTKEGEYPLNVYDYLVFEINGKTPHKILQDVWHSHGIMIQDKGDKTEIACHHPQIFHNGLLYQLEELGYIQVVWKEYFKEKVNTRYI